MRRVRSAKDIRKRYAVYARVSTDEQATCQLSVKEQVNGRHVAGYPDVVNRRITPLTSLQGNVFDLINATDESLPSRNAAILRLITI